MATFIKPNVFYQCDLFIILAVTTAMGHLTRFLFSSSIFDTPVNSLLFHIKDEESIINNVKNIIFWKGCVWAVTCLRLKQSIGNFYPACFLFA